MPKIPPRDVLARLRKLAILPDEVKKPTEKRRQRLLDLRAQMRDEQNEYEHIHWGPVRIIHDMDLLLFEYALHGLLGTADDAGYWAYQTARHYAEGYNSNQGTGLVSPAVPLVQGLPVEVSMKTIRGHARSLFVAAAIVVPSDERATVDGVYIWNPFGLSVIVSCGWKRVVPRRAMAPRGSGSPLISSRGGFARGGAAALTRIAGTRSSRTGTHRMTVPSDRSRW
jgi:hypothetical protein